jgi:hypothetical protein
MASRADPVHKRIEGLITDETDPRFELSGFDPEANFIFALYHHPKFTDLKLFHPKSHFESSLKHPGQNRSTRCGPRRTALRKER